MSPKVLFSIINLFLINDLPNNILRSLMNINVDDTTAYRYVSKYLDDQILVVIKITRQECAIEIQPSFQ